MWAFGVMLYEMCTAYKPTVLKNFEYGSGDIPFRRQDWKKLDHSKHIQELIAGCLEVDPTNRPTAEAALESQWFQECY